MSVFERAIYFRVLGPSDNCSECSTLVADSPTLHQPSDPHPHCKCRVTVEVATILVELISQRKLGLEWEPESGRIPPGGSITETVDVQFRDIEGPSSATLGGSILVTSGSTTITGDTRNVFTGESRSTTYVSDPSISDGWQQVYRFTRTWSLNYAATISMPGKGTTVEYVELHKTIFAGLGHCPVEGPYKPDFENSDVTEGEVPTPEDLGIRLEN